MDIDRIFVLLAEAKEARVMLDAAGLAYALQKNFSRTIEQIWADPEEAALFSSLEGMVDLVKSLPFEVDLWSVQKNYYELSQRVYPQIREQATEGDASAQAWIRTFLSVGEKLRVKVE